MGCFLGVPVRAVLSLWGTYPDFLFLFQVLRDAGCGFHEPGRAGLLLSLTEFILIRKQGDSEEPGSCRVFRRHNFKEEVKLLTVEWKVMRVPFPFSLSLR